MIVMFKGFFLALTRLLEVGVFKLFQYHILYIELNGCFNNDRVA